MAIFFIFSLLALERVLANHDKQSLVMGMLVAIDPGRPRCAKPKRPNVQSAKRVGTGGRKVLRRSAIRARGSFVRCGKPLRIGA